MSDYIMVLNDGTTYTNLEGCYVIEVPEGTEDVDEFLQGNESFPNIQALFGVSPDGGPFMIGKMPKLNATVIQ